MKNIPTQFLQNREKEVWEASGLELSIPCEMKLGPWNHSEDGWKCHAIWTQLVSWSGKNVMVIISNWGHVNSSYLLQVKWWWLDSFGQHTSTFQCLEYADLKHHEAKKHIGLKWNAWYSPNINLWFENWPTSPGLHFQCFVFLIWGTIHNTHATLIWMVLLWACNKGFFFNFVTGRKWWSPIRWSS
jgi:hypothetical protein